MSETFNAEQWLHGLLTGDDEEGGVNTLTGGRVYAYRAPGGAEYPLVIYGYQGGHDVRGVGATRIMASLVYQVKAIGRLSAVGFGAIEAIAERLDQLLQGASGSVVDGGLVLSCVREEPIAYPEIDGPYVFSHLGGLYRLQVR